MPSRSPSPNPAPRRRAGKNPKKPAPTAVVSVAELRELFDEVDMDASGTINWYELRLALQSAGQDASKAKEMIMTADTDGDGEIDFDEFVEVINSNFQTDEWLAFSTSLKHKLITKAKSTYQNVVPVVPVVPLAGISAPYPFPDPQGCGHCGKAIVGGWILTLLAAATGIGGLILMAINLYLMATQSTVAGLRIVGLKYVNMYGQDVDICRLLALHICAFLFTMLFGIEIWASLCDPECRTLSMQIMGIRFRNFGHTTAAAMVMEVDVQRLPAATLQRLKSGSTGCGVGCFVVVIILAIVALVAVLAATGLMSYFQCYMECQNFVGLADLQNSFWGGNHLHQAALSVCKQECWRAVGF